MQPELVEFLIPNHTSITEGEFAIMDAMCHIATMLTEMGLHYKEHWNLHESYYTNLGHKAVLIEFNNAPDAMIAKLKGLT
jgi:hypothetical protein